MATTAARDIQKVVIESQTAGPTVSQATASKARPRDGWGGWRVWASDQLGRLVKPCQTGRLPNPSRNSASTGRSWHSGRRQAPSASAASSRGHGRWPLAFWRSAGEKRSEFTEILPASPSASRQVGQPCSRNPAWDQEPPRPGAQDHQLLPVLFFFFSRSRAGRSRHDIQRQQTGDYGWPRRRNGQAWIGAEESQQGRRTE